MYVSKHENHDVIKCKHFRYWPFVRGIHWSLVASPHKGQCRRALMFSLICTWKTSWANSREAGELRCYHTHYDVTVIISELSIISLIWDGTGNWNPSLWKTRTPSSCCQYLDFRWLGRAVAAMVLIKHVNSTNFHHNKLLILIACMTSFQDIPDSKVHGANMGPTWVLLAPDGPHVGPINLVIRDVTDGQQHWLVLPVVFDCVCSQLGIRQWPRLSV